MTFKPLHFLGIAISLLLLAISPTQGWSQCTNASSFGSGAAPTSSTPVTLTTCAYGGEYSTVTGCVSGNTYLFASSGGSGNYLTIHQGTYNGPVLAFGFSPVSATCTASGSLFVHVNTNAACGTESVCHTNTVACSSCAPPGPSSNCTNTSAYPGTGISLATANAGTVQTITTCNYAGEYYGVTGVLSGASYTCTSSVAGDYLTVRSGTSGGAVVAQGTTPLTFLTSSTADLFVHINTATACGTQSACRTTTIVKNNITCTNSSQFPSGAQSLATTNSSGNTQTISTCNFAGDYFQLTTVVTGNPYQITSSVATDFITVRVGSVGGTILASGIQPLTVTPTSGSDLFVHINTNSSCGMASTCRTTTVRCTTCTPAPACVSAPTGPANGLSGICPNATQTLSWPVSSSATSYDLYFGTSATPPFFLNQAGTTYTTAALAAGTYYWQVRPRNSIGAASGCAIWSFTVGDVTAPTITCPTSVTASNALNQCSATVTYGSISATDNCAAPGITLVSGLASGSSFPVGVTTVVYRATDPSGNSSTCSFNITVNDTQIPTIACPANIASANDLNVCGAVKTYTTPSTTDNCPGATVTQLSGLPSGSVFPVGTTVNLFRAKDLANNSATCSFSIVITDTQAPSITCPSNKVKGNDPGDCGNALSTAELGTVTSSDNCGLASSSNTVPAIFPIGTTVVVYSTTDFAGNTKTCSQTVQVLDIEFPSISCPPVVTAAGESGVCATAVDFEAAASDNCPGVTVSYSTPPLSEFQVGSTLIKATATDASGNSAVCNFNVTVSAAAELCNNVDDDCDGWVDEAQDWDRVIKHGAKSIQANENFGLSVDLDDDWAIVGSKRTTPNGADGEAAYILFRSTLGDNKWGSVALLQPADLQAGDKFGQSVAISKLGYAAVGAPGDGIDGAVYVYELQASGAWMMVKKLAASDPDNSESFGSSVALDKGKLVVGDPDQAGQKGGAYVFERNFGGTGNWGEAAKLEDAANHTGDAFGFSVAVDSSWVVVGAPGDDQNGDHAGAAHSFKQGQSGYAHSKLTTNNGKPNDDFGHSVAVARGNIFVGAPGSDINGLDAGATFWFKSSGQQYPITEFGLKPGSHFGYDVDADQDYLVITAPLDSANFAAYTSARAYIYTGNDQGWVNMDVVSFPTAPRTARSNSVAAISGRSVILGAGYDDLSSSASSNGHGSISVYNGLCAGNKPAFSSDVAARSNDQLGGNVDVKCTPVPFNDLLNIDVMSENGDPINVHIYNGLGTEVARFDQQNIKGTSRFVWNSANQQQGVYYVKVQCGKQVYTKVVSLMK